MDPDANLEEQLKLAQDIVDGPFTNDDAIRLAELVLALHDWLSSGGFFPEEYDDGVRK